jgi:protein-S-isoprenylcysteine O-methyltransferase Ste14
MKYLVITLIWAGYCFLHSFMISIWFSNIMKRLLKEYYAFYRLFFVLVSTLLLFPIIHYTIQLDHEVVITYSTTLNIFRYILIALGVLVFVKAFFIDYDVLHFLGFRQAMKFNATEIEIPNTELKKSGLLGIVRHPMYFAVVVLLWCHSFTIADVIVNAVLTIYVVIGTFLEERKLVIEFGDSYIRYQKEVPMLIPFTRWRTNN